MTGNGSEMTPVVAVVDDEEDITTYLSCALEDAGYQVLVTNQSATAMTFLQLNQPDLICLDLLMPEQMGSSLFIKIRQDSQLGNIPVLILSGLAAQEEIEQLMTQQKDVPAPDGYIEKPIQTEILLRSISQILGGAPGTTGVETP